MSFDFDLAVIGSGPAGEKAAAKAAFFGKRVALIERNTGLGGACRTGGLPSKVLRQSALSYSGARRLGDVFSRAKEKLKMSHFLSDVEIICETRNERVNKNIRRHNIQLLSGAATFEDAHHLEIVHGSHIQRISAEVIVVATGSRPYLPASIPFDDTQVFCSDKILGIHELPQSMTVVGGGVIGCEYASIFMALGVEVHLVEERKKIIGFLDDEMSHELQASFRRAGMKTHMEQSLKECRLDCGKIHSLTSQGQKIVTDTLLFSGGRTANTESLGLERIGVKIGKHSRPEIDKNFRTSVENIYAVGDVVGFPGLASTAMEQGRVAMGHAFKLQGPQPFTNLPYGIYTIPSVSMIGKTEAQMKAEHQPYVVGKGYYADQDRAKLIGDLDGVLKLVCERDTLKIVGIHIVGELAEELIHVGQAVMQLGGTVDYFLQAVNNFPTLGSLYKAAAYDVLTRLNSQK